MRRKKPVKTITLKESQHLLKNAEKTIFRLTSELGVLVSLRRGHDAERTALVDRISKMAVDGNTQNEVILNLRNANLQLQKDISTANISKQAQEEISKQFEAQLYEIKNLYRSIYESSNASMVIMNKALQNG